MSPAFFLMNSEAKSFLAVLGMLLLFCLVLFLIYLPQPAKKRIKADLDDCQMNLKQIYSALVLYEQKYGSLPPSDDTEGLNLLFENHIDRDLTHFICPGTEDQTRGELRDDTLSYFYFVPANGKLGGKEILLCDHPGNHPGGVIQFVTGDGSFRIYRLSKPLPRKDLRNLKY